MACPLEARGALSLRDTCTRPWLDGRFENPFARPHAREFELAAHEHELLLEPVYHTSHARLGGRSAQDIAHKLGEKYAPVRRTLRTS